MRPGAAFGTARRKSMPREIGAVYGARASEVIEAKGGVLIGFRQPRGNVEDELRVEEPLRYRPPPPRRGGRVVECTGLENRSRVTPDRGFESLPLRSA